MKPTTIPSAVLDFCESAAAGWDLDLRAERDQRKIAHATLQLSDFFIQHPEESTPWEKNWAQLAYAFYFLPLNSIRVQRVLEQLPFPIGDLKLKQVFDFGAGLATASRLIDYPDIHLNLIEQAPEAQDLVRRYDRAQARYHWQADPPTREEVKSKPTLSCFSYSLTELAELPAWAWESRALLLIEPSTQEDGRKLMALRQKLIDRDFVMLAPCTHQLACPLLTQSKNDWCHDRVHTELPDWLRQIESYLPMKNRTLTSSYLFAVQKNYVPIANSRAPVARVVGDLLKEKGKDRQLICRGPEREYLAWMHKHGEHQEILRGELIDIPQELAKTANEIRVPGGHKLHS